ncbi:MAG: MlaD family protein [Bacteroidales bacterium]|jgi:phospholipid/cholesterol/gamma-HCH transport system substrate-binding protein|nr:MlaD family protein [Bacteroidales bacterium]
MKIRKEVKIAVVTIAAILLFIVCINFLRGKKLFSSENIFYAIYPKVEGLVASDPVKINGLKVGNVEKIDFIAANDTRVKVEIAVDKKIKIPKNTVIQLLSASIMGGQYVNLVLGSDVEFAKNGDVLEGTVATDLMSSIGDQIMPVKQKIESLAEHLDSLTQNINGLFDEKLEKNIKNSISNLNKSLVSLKNMTANADNLIVANKEKITDMIANLNKFSQDLKNAEVSKATANLNNSLTKLNTVLDSIQSGNGTAGMLIKDKKLYEEIANSADNLKLLLEDIKKNPKRYLTVKIF